MSKRECKHCGIPVYESAPDLLSLADQLAEKAQKVLTCSVADPEAYWYRVSDELREALSAYQQARKGKPSCNEK